MWTPALGRRGDIMAVVDLSGKKVLICYIEKSINDLLAGKPNRKTFLDCVCKYWEIPDINKANSVDFVIGVNADKNIVVIAKPNENGWRKVKTFPKLKAELSDNKFLERFAFEGIDISKTTEALPYIGKTLPSNIKFFKDIPYPLYCINGNIIDW